MDALTSNPVNKQSNKTDREIKDWTEYAKKDLPHPSQTTEKRPQSRKTHLSIQKAVFVSRRDAAASHRMNLNEFRFGEYARIAKWVLPSGCKVKNGI